MKGPFLKAVKAIGSGPAKTAARYFAGYWPAYAVMAGYLGRTEAESLALLGGVYASFLAMSAFFSGTETAVVAARVYKLRDRRVVEEVDSLKKKEELMQAILLGNNAVNIALGSLGASLAMGLHMNSGQAALFDLINVGILYIFGETLPKNIALRSPERWLSNPLVRTALKGLRQVGKVARRAVAFLTPPLQEESKDSYLESLRELLFHLPNIGSYDRKVLEDVFAFISSMDQPLEKLDVVVRRAEEVAVVGEQEEIGEAYSRIMEEHGRLYSRIIVVEDPSRPLDRDNIRGVLHAREVLERIIGNGRRLEGRVGDYAREKILLVDGRSTLGEVQRRNGSLPKVIGVVDEGGRVKWFLFLSYLGDSILKITEEEDRRD